jgi:hypothetical protein
MVAAAMDKAPALTLLAVTDRRIITTKTDAFLEQGEIRRDIPIDEVRYVRAGTTRARSARSAIDLITRHQNIQWLFQLTSPPPRWTRSPPCSQSR